jgi:hypothetical protein
MKTKQKHRQIEAAMTRMAMAHRASPQAVDGIIAEWVPVFTTDVPAGDVWRVLGLLAASIEGEITLKSARVAVISTPRYGPARERLLVTVGDLPTCEAGSIVWLEPMTRGGQDTLLSWQAATALGGRKPPKEFLRSKPPAQMNGSVHF